MTTERQVLSEFVTIFRLNVAIHLLHQLVQARRQVWLSLRRLARNDLSLQVSVDLLANENEGQHGPRQ
eukprot:CAMPEP_0119112004 /NCGR_PEP_ID=MMETSP1180-20130426/38225_2 /TAXON_ID=3052 ORGANISM="Chlamydomonas cf sp, Strain CCMP681" /NCGR_SAMPLE_ID=MMETSP1180 /ASSEMBLY_ACC=CAM_ASM_000741 /LENGTH=67 /DNA_ID=CAMNT_0007099289 /DNA_START=152 /DNA_END=352 /DNA_ORIENTATION=-